MPVVAARGPHPRLAHDVNEMTLAPAPALSHDADDDIYWMQEATPSSASAARPRKAIASRSSSRRGGVAVAGGATTTSAGGQKDPLNRLEEERALAVGADKRGDGGSFFGRDGGAEAAEANHNGKPKTTWTARQQHGGRERVLRLREEGELGAGGFARCVRAVDRDTGESFAVKIPRPSDKAHRAIANEIAFHRTLRHSHLVEFMFTLPVPEAAASGGGGRWGRGSSTRHAGEYHQHYHSDWGGAASSSAGEDEVPLCLVTEVCDPRSASKLIRQRRRQMGIDDDPLAFGGGFAEEEAGILGRALADVIAYMHRQHLVHRDVKLNNVLFAPVVPEEEREENGGKKLEGGAGDDGQQQHEQKPLTLPGVPKLGDLGLCVRAPPRGGALHRYCGSLHSMAPEIVVYSTEMRRYGPGVDAWALGIAIYHAIAGRTPFVGSSRDATIRNIQRASVKFPARDALGQPIAWSDDARDLIARLLCKDPAGRITARQALQHPFLRSPPAIQQQRPGNASSLSEAAPLAPAETEEKVDDERVVTGHETESSDDDERPSSGSSSFVLFRDVLLFLRDHPERASEAKSLIDGATRVADHEDFSESDGAALSTFCEAVVSSLRRNNNSPAEPP